MILSPRRAGVLVDGRTLSWELHCSIRRDAAISEVMVGRLEIAQGVEPQVVEVDLQDRSEAY